VVFQKECHDRVTLRGAAEAAVVQGALDGFGIHERLDYI
jgi:hypothetical protein